MIKNIIPMTISKLKFTVLSLGFTILLISLWFVSFRFYSEFAFSSRKGNFTLSCNFHSAAIKVVLEPHDSSKHVFYYSCVPAKASHYPFFRESIDSSSPFGVLEASCAPSIECGEGPGHYDYYVAMPIWLFYLIVLGLGAWRLTSKQYVMAKQAG
jgi:hypothetical protein